MGEPGEKEDEKSVWHKRYGLLKRGAERENTPEQAVIRLRLTGAMSLKVIFIMAKEKPLCSRLWMSNNT